MDWKGFLASTFSTGCVLAGGFWLEPMWPLGDYRWGIIAAICLIATIAIYAVPPLWRRLFPKNRNENEQKIPEYSDWSDANHIIGMYIDPENSMKSSTKIIVKAQILNKFEQVVGAKNGDNYNIKLLHLWLQKNAAKTLVNHQNEIV